MLMLLSIAILQVTLASKVQRASRVLHKYSGLGCNAAAVTDTWTMPSATTTDLKQCTVASHSTAESSGSEHSIGDLTLIERKRVNTTRNALLQQQNTVETIHMQCYAGQAEFGAFNYAGSSTPTCSDERLRQTFTEAQHAEFIAGRCADTVEGNSMEVDVTGLTLGSCTVGVTGDPHLTNLRGQKFDIHDGLHRLVHYPRDAPEEEALFKIDARAVDIGPEADCYSVFLQNIKLSGKWVGDAITLSTNTSVASSSARSFGMSFALQQMDWPTLTKLHGGHLELKGSMPVTVTTSAHGASADTVGGEEINFKVGDQHPMFVQVWSSHGKNWLTHEKDVRFLNVQVKNLPKDAGGILGLDSYTKPSASRCGLVQQERDLMDYIGKDLSLLAIKTRKSSPWTASATLEQ